MSTIQDCFDKHLDTIVKVDKDKLRKATSVYMDMDKDLTEQAAMIKAVDDRIEELEIQYKRIEDETNAAWLKSRPKSVEAEQADNLPAATTEAKEETPAEAKELDAEKIKRGYANRSIGGLSGKVEMERNWFADAIKKINEHLQIYARNDEQKTKLDKMIEDFKVEYVNRRHQVMTVGESAYSAAVAGPSNFNSKQSDRRFSALDKVEKSFNEWLEAWHESAKSKLLSLRSEEERDADNSDAEERRVKAAVKRVLGDLAMIGGIDEGKAPGMDRAAFTSGAVRKVTNLHDAGDTEALRRVFNAISDWDVKHKKPLFSQRSPIWQYKPESVSIPSDAIGTTVSKDDELQPREGHAALFKSLMDGTATVEDYQAGFKATLDAEDAIKSELNAMTKDGIFNVYPGLQYRYKSEKKAAIVDAVFDGMVDRFAIGRGISYTFGANMKQRARDAVSDMVKRTTQAELDEYAEAQKKERAEFDQRSEKAIEAIKDPKTLDDFITYLRAKMQDGATTFKEARMSLTPEQRAKFDELSGEKTRDERKARADQQKTEIRVAAQTTDGQVIETKHTKTGEPLFVVKAAERVERDIYNQWNSTAKRLGGWYSSFKGNGAIPGFQFKSRENADAFLKYLGGNVDQAKDAVQERRDSFQDDRSQSAVERLNEMADRLEDRADESLGRDRKANTSRRARYAASAEAAANAEKALAKTMRNIANAISSGKAKFLDRVRQKSQIEMLQGFVRSSQGDEHRAKYPSYMDQEKHRGEAPTIETADYTTFPAYTAYRSDLAKLGRQLSENDGTKKLGAAILKVADDVTDAYIKFAKENLHKVSTFKLAEGKPAILPSKDMAEEAIKRSGFKGKAVVLPFKRGQNIIIMSPSEAQAKGIWQGDDDKRITLNAETGAEIVEKAKGSRAIETPWQFQSAYDNLKRLSALGIETPAEFRAALREFIGLKEEAAQPDKVKEMERAMIGRAKDGLDFFPTPASVAQQMVETADIKEGMTVLEPSAGMGHIAEQIREAGVDPDVVEMSNDRRELLEAKGFNVVGRDFMEVTGEYDRVVMNPPFSDRRDIEHVRHAYSLLKPGGRLVAILGEGSFFGSDKKATEFRDWMESLGGTSEKLDEGTFLDPSLPVNTGVNARLVVIDKPEGETKFSRRPAFFSPLSKAIEAAKQDSMPAAQWKLWLQGNKAKLGLKDDELTFSGILDYLELRGKDKVTKAEIADYLSREDAISNDDGMKTGESGLPLAPDQSHAAILNKALVDYGLGKDWSNSYEAVELPDTLSAIRAEVQAAFWRDIRAVAPTAPGFNIFNGMRISQDRDGIYVNAQTEVGFLNIAGHELLHDIKSRSPALYAYYAEAAKPYLKNLPAYRARLNAQLQSGEPLYDNEAAMEELLADFMGDSLTDPAFLQQLADRNSGKFKQFINAVRLWLSGVASKLRGFDSANHISDVKALQKYLADVLVAYADGKKIATVDAPAMLERNGEKLDAMRESVRMSRTGDTITVDGKERSAADAEYFDAVQRGDMDAAQRMVDMKLSASGSYWHGTPSGNLRGGVSGLHIGTKQAATEALEARIGIPADGKPWDGTRKYGETLLAGRDQVASGQFGPYRNTGYNSRSPSSAFYARDYEMPTVGDGVKVDPDWKPYVRPVLVVGETSNTQRSPMSDSRANATMKAQLTRGTAKRGFYYRNEGEDFGSVSAVFPNGDAVRVKLPDAVTRDDDGNVIPLSRRFDTTNTDIRFSRRQDADSIWSSEPISKMDTFLYEITDKQVDTKRTIEAIKKTGKEIADKWNTYIQEALYHGRTAKKTDDFLRDEAEPLIKKMADAKVTQDELNEYLHALHAMERNDVMKERNPDREDNDGLSGMSDEDALEILENARPELEAIANDVRAMVKKTSAELVAYGLEKQETVDAWAAMYEYYVPLKREGFEQRPGTGMGFAVRGSSTREATGSHRAVDNILANIAMQRERAIVRGEKNRVALSLYGLAKQFPNSKFWKLDKPAQITQINQDTGMPEVVPGDMADYKVPRVKYVGPDGTVQERVDPNYKGRNNVLTARINGEDRAIIFNEQEPRALRMVEALKNLDADQLGEILGGIGRVTRYIASMNTQYNPVFGVINLMRDLQTGALNLSSTELKGKQKEVIGQTISALKGIYLDARAVRSGRHPSSSWATLWEEFQGVGGQTGYRQMFATSNDRAEAIEHLLDPEWWQKSKLGKVLTLNGFIAKPEQYLFDKVGKHVFQWLSDYNLAMENSVRLAAYKVGTENGMSKESAAFLAKNLTVNFNKKGRVATQAGALYAFFNASAQGTARIAETLHAGAADSEYLGKVGKQIVLGGITLGAMQALTLMLAGFDDDEPPEFIRERNLIIPVPGTEKGYVTIPMPLGFHVLPNIGRTIIESAVYGKPLDRMTDLMMTMLESFNPIGTGASMAQTISPTVFDPVVALSENKDWTGKAIYREDFSKNNPTPGFTRTKDSASGLAMGIAWGINAATGGTDYTPGRFSPTPDEIDYLIGQATGGVGREVTKVMTTAGAIATGEDLPLYKVPLVGRLAGTSADNAAIRDKFYDHIRELNLHKSEIKGRKENGESTLEYRKDNPETRLIGFATMIESDVRELQKRRKKYLDDGNREKVNLIELQIAARMNRLNSRMRDAQK